MTEARTWSGEEWEDYVLKLLRLRYPTGDLVEIPDRDRGDAGLEAYGRDGCAFQCYAPEDPLSVEERYVKQRDKMTRDLAKFTNQDRLAPLLGRTVVRRWILVVPRVDSRKIVEHAQTKAQEIRSLGLPYVHADFEVAISTDDAFEAERAQVVRLALAELSLDTAEPTQDRIAEFAGASGSLVDTMDRKLGKVPDLAQQEARDEYRSELLAAYLRGSDGLDQLRADYPDLVRPVERVIADRRRNLILQHRVAGQPAGATLNQVVSDLASGVAERLPGLRRGDVDDIAWSTTAQWLMECPLDFPDV